VLPLSQTIGRRAHRWKNRQMVEKTSRRVHMKDYRWRTTQVEKYTARRLHKQKRIQGEKYM